MHRFFSDGLEPLHAHVVDLLAETSVHDALPLLGVNKAFRALAISRMLKAYHSAKVVRVEKDSDGFEAFPIVGEGEYILMIGSGWNQDGPREHDDPRSILSSSDEAQERAQEYGTPLLLSSFDSATMLCTFKPALKKGGGINYSLPCNEHHVQWCDLPTLFEVRPTGWVRKAREKTPFVLDGLELSARPDRFPPTWDGIIDPKVPDRGKEGEADMDQANVEVDDAEVSWKYKEWRISYINTRADWLAEKSGFGVDVPALLEVKTLKVPFIDLFAPRTALNEKGYYDDW